MAVRGKYNLHSSLAAHFWVGAWFHLSVAITFYNGLTNGGSLGARLTVYREEKRDLGPVNNFKLPMIVFEIIHSRIKLRLHA